MLLYLAGQGEWHPHKHRERRRFQLALALALQVDLCTWPAKHSGSKRRQGACKPSASLDASQQESWPCGSCYRHPQPRPQLSSAAARRPRAPEGAPAPQPTGAAASAEASLSSRACRPSPGSLSGRRSSAHRDHALSGHAACSNSAGATSCVCLLAAPAGICNVFIGCAAKTAREMLCGFHSEAD